MRARHAAAALVVVTALAAGQGIAGAASVDPTLVGNESPGYVGPNPPPSSGSLPSPTVQSTDGTQTIGITAPGGQVLNVTVKIETKSIKRLRQGLFSVSIASDLPVALTLSGSVSPGSRTIRTRAVKVPLTTSGSTTTSLPLPRSARKALRSAKKAKISVTGSATLVDGSVQAIDISRSVK